MPRPSGQEALARDAMKALAYGWCPLSGSAQQEFYSMLAYKAPRNDASLQFATQLQSALSAVCNAATFETVAADASLVQHNVNLARSRLRDLNLIWGCLINKDGVSDDESKAAKDHARRLFAVHHGCLPLLLATHAWALRASSPSCNHQISGVRLLLMDLQFAIRAVLAAEPVAPVDAPLSRTWEAVATAFLRTQPMHSAAVVLHAHRQQLDACRGDLSSELRALRTAANAWTGAVDLTAFFTNTHLALGSAAESMIPSDLASSHILQHLCALRLDLGEGLARVGHGDGEEAGSGATASAAGVKQLIEKLEGKDMALLGAIASVSYLGPRTGESHVSVQDLSVSMELKASEPSSSVIAVRSALSHPAVQCLLGWWLVAPGAAAGGGGGSAWGLPGPLLRHVRDMGDRDKLCVQALKSAALCWDIELRLWQDPSCPQDSSAAAAAAAAAWGLDGEAGCGSAAVPAMLPGAAAPPRVSGPLPAGAPTTSISQDLQRGPFPYSPVQMYRMCTAAFPACFSLAEQGRQSTRFNTSTLTSAMEKGLGVLVGSLMRMPPAQAARHLAPVWQVLLRVMRRGPELSNSAIWWCMARLLGELPHHLQQQHGQQEVSAEQSARASEAAGSGATAGCSRSDHGEGAAAPGEAGDGVAHVVACALEAGLLPALEASTRHRVTQYQQQHSASYELKYCAVLVDLALRRPGCWPALLAHGDPRQAAALVVSLRKAARGEEAGKRTETAVWGRPESSSCSLLQLELLALLEQLGPRPCGGDGGGGGAEEADIASGYAGWPDLRLNRWVGGVEREGDKGAGAGLETSGGSSSSSSSTPPAWAAGPTWQQVAAAGGCPAPGTPPQLQLARLTALAATEWLPVLITRPANPAASVAARAPRAAAPLPDLLPHKAYRVAWAWLRLVARQVLAFAPDGSCTVHAGWTSFLVDRLKGIDQAWQVISLVNGRTHLRTHRLEEGVREALLAARELLPCALDVLEVVALAAPEQLREALVERGADSRGGLAGTEPWGTTVHAVVDGQPGREPLAAAFSVLAAGERPSGAGRCSSPVWDELRRVVRLRVCREGLPLLPGPHVHGDVGLPHCANAWCTRVEGPSEAGVRLQACGRCRAVGYCCAECQRADWAAGHKAACGKGPGAGSAR